MLRISFRGYTPLMLNMAVFHDTLFLSGSKNGVLDIVSVM